MTSEVDTRKLKLYCFPLWVEGFEQSR